MKRFSPFVVYTSARLALFILTAIVLAVAGMKGVALLLVALIVSGLLSYVLLSRMRDAMSAAVVTRAGRDGDTRPAGRLARMRARLDERTRAEDDDEPYPSEDDEPQQ